MSSSVMGRQQSSSGASSKKASNRNSSASPTSSGRKIQLAPPTGVGDFFGGVAIHASRKYLFIDINKRVIFYLTLVTLGSVISHFMPLPRNWYLAQKHNILNQWFVKLSWGWTFILIGAFVYYTSQVYSCSDYRNIRQQCARLVVGTVLWYICTSLFVHVEKSTSFCTLPSTNMEDDCNSLGGRWFHGFDISGHCFLLIFCILLIEEEVKVFRNWERLRRLLDLSDNDPPELAALTEEEVERARRLHVNNTPIIKGLFLAITVLHIIWELMLLITVLYYHELPHKLAGALIGVGCWAVTYRLWYRTTLSPGLPGHCKIRYISRPT